MVVLSHEEGGKHEEDREGAALGEAPLLSEGEGAEGKVAKLGGPLGDVDGGGLGEKKHEAKAHGGR